MIGAITAWSGSIASIPDGWALCDGNNSTPDLRDRFVIGVGSSHALNSTGGSASVVLSTTQIPSHTHGSGGGSTVSSANHTHSVTVQYGSSTGAGDTSGCDTTGWTFNSTGTFGTSTVSNHNHSISGSLGNTGSGLAHENRPPYYALAFIMAVA